MKEIKRAFLTRFQLHETASDERRERENGRKIKREQGRERKRERETTVHPAAIALCFESKVHRTLVYGKRVTRREWMFEVA